LAPEMMRAAAVGSTIISESAQALSNECRAG
jgi:hypothetical protein